MSETMFLLTGESGEYEQRFETILGLFATRSDAERSAIEFSEISAREWEAREAFCESAKAAAEANGFPNTYILTDRNAWERHIDEVARIKGRARR